MGGKEAEREATKLIRGVWGTQAPQSLVGGREGEEECREGSDQAAVSSLKYFKATWSNTPPA